jgi:hypothetical protein
MMTVFVFMACTSISISLHADDGRSDPSQGLQKETIVIVKKNRTRIEDSSYRQYQVSQRTLIIGTDGKQMRYFDMSVPCEAEVYYRMENGNRQLLQAKIRLIRPGAGSSFSKDIIE